MIVFRLECSICKIEQIYVQIYMHTINQKTIIQTTIILIPWVLRFSRSSGKIGSRKKCKTQSSKIVIVLFFLLWIIIHIYLL